LTSSIGTPVDGSLQPLKAAGNGLRELSGAGGIGGDVSSESLDGDGEAAIESVKTIENAITKTNPGRCHSPRQRRSRQQRCDRHFSTIA